MFGGVYGDVRMPNWPHRHRTPLPGIATLGLPRDKGEIKKGVREIENVDRYIVHI